MLKISVLESSGIAVTLLLEGRIVEGDVKELRSSSEQVLDQARQLTLDVSGISFIDRKGIALLHALAGREVRIVNYSDFIAELLKAHATE